MARVKKLFGIIGRKRNASLPQFKMRNNTKAEGMEKQGMKSMTNAFVIVEE